MAGRNRFRRENNTSVSIGSLIITGSDNRLAVGIITHLWEADPTYNNELPKKCRIRWNDNSELIDIAIWSVSQNNCVSGLGYRVLVR